MKMRHLKLLLVLFALAGCRKSDYVLDTDKGLIHDYGAGIGNITLKKGQDYLFEGFVFVNDGQTLTIEPGTTLRFKAGKAENASALIVARGGKIIASGTAEEPIIFTSEKDDLKGSVAVAEQGLWGGLIILGNAPLNTTGSESNIEGIPLMEPRGVFGGNNKNDNSGVLRYVSIRHGGTDIGEGNEINGLTLGGVGSGTVIDYVEVISNNDDGIEIFGGNVNLKHIVVSNCDDDAFDYDLGWNGNGQFWLGVQSAGGGDKLIEAGGGVNPVEGLPYSLPDIFNVTLVGNGSNGQSTAIAFENNAGGVIANSIIMNKATGIMLQSTDQLHDSYFQWKNNRLSVRNNVFFQVGSSNPESVFKLTGYSTETMKKEWIAAFESNQNQILDPKINLSGKNYVPQKKITGMSSAYPDNWFQTVDFLGAFGEINWTEGWTLLSH